jgi:hypothetical protein
MRLLMVRLVRNPGGQLCLADAPLAADAEARQGAREQEATHGGDAHLETSGDLLGRQGHV